MTSLSHKTLALLNALFLGLTIFVNYLANALPIGGLDTGQLSDLYPNLFVPAGLTFAIWGVIYLLLIGFVIKQLVDARVDPADESRDESTASLWIATHIWPWFVLSCLANMSRIFARHYRYVGLSLVIMLCILATLIVLFRKTSVERTRWSLTNNLLIQTPFSVYVWWISVATIANVTTLLVNIGRDGWGMTDAFWTILVICVATLLWVIYLYRYASVPYALVILRAFLGIYIKRSADIGSVDLGDPTGIQHILITLGICGVILTGGVIYTSQRRWKGMRGK